jgi:hypothetical protein
MSDTLRHLRPHQTKLSVISNAATGLRPPLRIRDAFISGFGLAILYCALYDAITNGEVIFRLRGSITLHD